MFKTKHVAIVTIFLSFILAIWITSATNVSAAPAFSAYPQITQQDAALLKKQAFDAPLATTIPAGRIIMVLRPRACVNAFLGLKCDSLAYVQYADESLGKVYYGYLSWGLLGPLYPTP